MRTPKKDPVFEVPTWIVCIVVLSEYLYIQSLGKGFDDRPRLVRKDGTKVV